MSEDGKYGLYVKKKVEVYQDSLVKRDRNPTPTGSRKKREFAEITEKPRGSSGAGVAGSQAEVMVMEIDLHLSASLHL